MKPAKQVKKQPQQPQKLTRESAIANVLLAVEHAAYAGAFREFNPQARALIAESVELLKQPEPQPEKPCEGCDEKTPAKGKGK